MSVYLTRTLLLSLGIGIFLTVCYHAMRHDLGLSSRSTDPGKTFSATFIIHAAGYPAEPGAQKEFKNSLHSNIAATKQRLAKAGLNGKVSLQDDSIYSVVINDVSDTNSIGALVGSNSNFACNEVYNIGEVAPGLSGLDQHWLRFTGDIPGDKSTSFYNTVFMAANPMPDENGSPFYSPHLGLIDRSYASLALKMLSDPVVLQAFPADIVFALGDLDQRDQLSSKYQLLYAMRKNTDPISNSNIVEAKTYIEVDDRPYVSLQFDAVGTRHWQKLTERNVGRAIAICINDKVIVAPRVMEPIVTGNSRILMSSEAQSRVSGVLLTCSQLKLPVQLIHSEVKEEEKRAPGLLKRYSNHILIFLISFAISFCVIWFVFKPGKKLSGNA